MAIAIATKGQQLVFREDILKKLKIKPPKTYASLLKAAEKIKKSGLVEYPLGGTYKSGWYLGSEFVNIYLGLDGKFFGKNKRATVNNKKGVRTLELMKNLTNFMDPNYLQADDSDVQKQLQQGKIAMANLLLSSPITADNQTSQFLSSLKTAKTPSAKRGGKPATTLWWDAFVFAENMNEQEADAAFQLAMRSIDQAVIKANSDRAVWLSEGFQEGEFAKGIMQAAKLDAPTYPVSAAMVLMHDVLGQHIGDFLTDKKTARETLSAINKAYNSAAKQQGLYKIRHSFFESVRYRQTTKLCIDLYLISNTYFILFGKMIRLLILI